ncbi:hypothetical protein AB0H69_03420 [Streptomyces phaeochromogenes]
MSSRTAALATAGVVGPAGAAAPAATPAGRPVRPLPGPAQRSA